MSFVNLAADVNQLVASGLPNITCTNCIKEAYTIARQDFPDIFSNGDISSPIVSLCGAPFIGEQLLLSNYLVYSILHSVL